MPMHETIVGNALLRSAELEKQFHMTLGRLPPRTFLARLSLLRTKLEN